ncbi:MAG TPA: GGDEF domain-containing protein [Phycisphaerae bacterium]|nr:GGDEF domain-containing protein [Phycisphaerae bacterium]
MASPQLPTLPAVAIRALELTRRDNVNLNEIAELISNDPALSTKILKTVNSPFYGLPKQVSTISHALVILGLQAVKTLALGFSLITNLQAKEPIDGFDHMRFWKRSIFSGAAARVLAKHMAMVQQEEAFLAGLLANVGVLVMHRVLGAEFDELYVRCRGDNDDLLPLCQARFHLDHIETGTMLASHWQLPPVLARPISCHHAPSDDDHELKPLVEVVHVGVIIGDVFAAADPAPYIVRARKEMTERFKFSPEETEQLLAEIGSSTRDVAKLFEVNIGVNRSYAQILEEAQQALVQLTLQSQQQVRTIQKENETLQARATTDPLTGLANRARFDEFLEEQFTRAYRLQRPLALLFLDIDHFKKVNDTYGHPAGDEVLRRVARVLKAACRSIDLAARYGGEEFAIVLTETETPSASQTAEKIRRAIESEGISFEGNVLKITASLGIAGTDRTRIFSVPAQLTSAADRASYASKMSGRNCVRLFRPKAATPGVAAHVAS